jgi:Predicted O-methyltransferase
MHLLKQHNKRNSGNKEFWKIRRKNMNLDEASSYINRLYEKRGINRKEYMESTELEKFGSVVDEDVSRALQVLFRIIRPHKVLEIGTSIGYSTVSMASVVKEYGGKITTVEYDERVAEHAVNNFRRFGVLENIDVKIGDAQEIIPQMESEKFDVIFQDVGDKKLYPLLFDDCVRVLKPGGLLLAEDTLFPVMDRFKQHHNELVVSINEFNEMVADNPHLESTLLSIGDGLTVAIKK